MTPEQEKLICDTCGVEKISEAGFFCYKYFSDVELRINYTEVERLIDAVAAPYLAEIEALKTENAMLRENLG